MRVADMHVYPFWQYTLRRRRDNAFIRYLGIPTFMFDEICRLCRPYFPAYLDPEAGRRRGRPATLTYVDAVAMALRRLQLNCSKLQEVLRIDFGGAAGSVSELLAIARPIWRVL